MQTQNAPKIAKWPFALADAALLAGAYFICRHGHLPLNLSESFLLTLCVALAAGFGIWPFLAEFRAASKLVESASLFSVVSQIQNLEELAGQIKHATAQWQTVHESADKTAAAARQISKEMADEAKGFQQFLERANDSEKAALRLEVEKLRRAEAEWLQTLVRVLDHTYALHRAAIQSRQPSLIEQLGHFQNACRDAARRVGLTPFSAASDEKFDGQKHQLLDGEPPAEVGIVDETVATGYTFQGRLLRPALVRLRNGNGAHSQPADGESAHDPDQDQLPLEPPPAAPA